MAIDKQELADIVAKVWPLTKIAWIAPNHKNLGGWTFTLRTKETGLETYHQVDGVGRPTCHADCKARDHAVHGR